MTATCALAGVDNSSERLSESQFSTFSPGYINAAKQKTDAVINQLNIRKSFMDSVTEFVKGKLANKVTEDSQNAVAPELKRKKGSGAEQAVKTGEAVSLSVIAVSNPNNAVVEQALTEISNNRGVDSGNIKYEGLSNGSVAFTWMEGSVLRSQIYDQNAKSLVENFVNASGSGDYLLKALTNDTFVLGYNNAGTKFKIYNADGSVYKDEFSGGSAKLIGIDCGEKASITALSDGRFAVAWSTNSYSYDGDNESYSSAPHAYFKIFDSEGKSSANIALIAPRDESWNIHWNWDPKISMLASGDIVASWHYNQKSYFQIFDSSGVAIKGMETARSLSSYNTQEANIRTLSDGSFLISWSGGPGGWVSFVQKFDSEGNAMDVAKRICTNLGGAQHDPTITELSNGNFLVTNYTLIAGGNSGYYATIYDSELDSVISSYKFNSVIPKYITDIKIDAMALANGTFSLAWYNPTGDYSYNQFDSKGELLERSQILDMGPSRSAASERSVADIFLSDLTRMYKTLNDSLYSYISDTTLNPVSADKTASIFKGLIANKGAIMNAESGGLYAAKVNDIVESLAIESTLAIPVDIVQSTKAQEMEIALILAGILNNPTEDQKNILNAVEALLVEINAIEEASLSPEAIRKTENDLLQMVAAILIAQAIPDLLKEGDVSNIKDTFSELNSVKSRILIEYGESIKPYYEEMKKLLSDNIAILQLNNIISKNMAEQELAKLEPNGVDKILEKLRKASNKSFDEEYILQQEAKYRKQYIDPNKKVIEDKMKDMMKDFTKRLSGILEETKGKGRER